MAETPSIRADILKDLCGHKPILNEVVGPDFKLKRGQMLQFDQNGIKKEYVVLSTNGLEAFAAPVARVASTGKLQVSREAVIVIWGNGGNFVEEFEKKNGDGNYITTIVGELKESEIELKE